MGVESFKIEGLEGVLKALHGFPRDVVSRNGGPVRKALRKAALILREEAALNIQRIMDDPSTGSAQYPPTGRLKAALTVERSSFKSNVNGEKFLVRLRQRGYPQTGVSTRQVGRLLEYGTEGKIPAQFWLRRAFDAKKSVAVNTFTNELWKELNRLAKKHRLT